MWVQGAFVFPVSRSFSLSFLLINWSFLQWNHDSLLPLFHCSGWLILSSFCFVFVCVCFCVCVRACMSVKHTCQCDILCWPLKHPEKSQWKPALCCSLLGVLQCSAVLVLSVHQMECCLSMASFLPQWLWNVPTVLVKWPQNAAFSGV